MSFTLRRPRPLRPVLAILAAVSLAPAAASAATLPVSGQQTALAPSEGLVSVLTTTGTSVKGIGTTTADSAGRFVFPVTGGQLTTPSLAGRVNHGGGLEFKNKYGVKFGIKSFVIDTRASGAPVLTALPTIGGVALGLRLPVATIAGLQVATEGDVTVLTGALTLNGIGAFYINTFLGKTAVKSGTVLGAAEARVTLG